MFPYGDKAYRNTNALLQVSSPAFSITLSCMYPFIVEDKSKWQSLLTNCLYPIKQLWPKGILKRYMNFIQVFAVQREEMFEAYEASGGVYHGAEEKSSDGGSETEEKEYEDVELDCDKGF